MNLGKVIGTVIASQKDPSLTGSKLMVVKNIDLEGNFTGSFTISVDVVQSGVGDTVLCASGSSARQTEKTKNRPVDNVIIGIVDEVKVEKDWAKKSDK